MKKNISKFTITIFTAGIFLLSALSLLFFLNACKIESGAATGPTKINLSGESAAVTLQDAQPSNNQQIIEVRASGGYLPKKIEAKAGVPAILIMKSEGAYGCERAFNIPGLNINEILPENGETLFDLGIHASGTELAGVCSMGMYYFKIFFN